MINGNVNDFVDKLYYGDELIFIYQGNKYFIQGFFEEGIYRLYVDRWNPPSDDYIWVGKGDNHNYPVKEFLDAKIWNNKSFWQVENEMEWVDA